MPTKLYISQANQAHNAGPGGYTERAGMDAISKATAAVFAKDSRFLVKRNVAGNRVDTAEANCAEANVWGADYYVALHSNSGEKGTVVFYYSTSAKGKRLATALCAAIAPLSPGKEYGNEVKDWNGLIEIHTPHAPAVLIEMEAHDWKTGTTWLTGQRPQIAQALYEGICKGVGLAPRMTKSVPAKPAPVKKPLTTGKTTTVKVPTVRPEWWGKLMAWVKSQR